MIRIDDTRTTCYCGNCSIQTICADNANRPGALGTMKHAEFSHATHITNFHASPQENVSRQTRLVLGTSPGPPTGLILQYEITSFAATSKARYTEYVLPIYMIQNSEFGSVYKGFIMNGSTCCDSASHRDCRSVLNDMSPIKSHIKRVMIHTNSHVPVMYVLVLMKSVRFAIK